MSTHAIEIIEVTEIREHPNADRLHIIPVYGWQCCSQKGNFELGDRAVYIPPDYEVPNTDMFAFLFEKHPERNFERIRVKRLRGQLSQGLLLPVPEALAHLPVGSNVIEELGIRRYEPPTSESTGGESVAGPSASVFDLESYERYADTVLLPALSPTTHLIVTEKIHGANAKFVFDGGVQYCGSRTRWLKDGGNVWWNAFKQHAWIGQWCQANPGVVLYGEVFGNVQQFKYGVKPGEVFFAAFAACALGQWWEYDQLLGSVLALEGSSLVPVLYRGPFVNHEHLRGLSEGKTTWPAANGSHMREGIVVVPETELWSPEIGRVALKLVNADYLALDDRNG